jgi:hypothetical protein
MPEFDDLKPFPGEEAPDRHHNRPPLDEQVVLDFETALHARKLDERVREIREQADKAPPVDSVEVCGLVGDLVAMARAVSEAVEGEREKLNRPLLVAQRSLKAQSDRLLAPMSASIGALRKRLDEFMELQDEAVRGDYGARVGKRTEWSFRITDVDKLPVDVRFHPDVLDAMKKVVAARVRTGTRQMTGVEIFSETKATVR